MLAGIDLTIVIIYFVIVLAVGAFVSKRAAGSIDDYFLGKRTIPWFILGLSGMATYIDMSGTMVQVSFFYMLGVKGYWVAYRGAVALFLAFLMIFMAKWLNRSKVMTNAEWMIFRFGKDRQGQLARILSALSIIVLIIAFIGYFFVGTGKFLSGYVPLSPEISALIFFAIVTIYTAASGFYGVVYTDIFQSILILGIIGFIAVKAMIIGTPEYYNAFATTEWRSIIPSWEMIMPQGYESMHLFGLLILFWIIANIFQGFGLPFDAWTSQRYYAAKNERESALVAAQWIGLFSLRFLLMMGVGILALGIADKISDPEMALPAVIDHYVPSIVKGLLLAALIAAAMSTLDSFVNSSAAYFVKDIYKAYLKPDAGDKHLIKVSYGTTAIIMTFGIILGWNIPNINAIWGWMVMGLFTGMLPPNILKWFWWRFNGMGYAFGMGAGIIAAVVHTFAFSGAPEYMTFTFVTIISTAGTVLGVFLGKPTEMSVLINFYKTTQPFGFWGPVRQACDEGFVAEVRKENRRDLLLLVPACVWQVTLFWAMTALVVKKWEAFFYSSAVVVGLSIVLYNYWYKNLKRV